MSRPKRKRQPTAYEIAKYDFENTQGLTAQERDDMLSGRAAQSIYKSETGNVLPVQDENIVVDVNTPEYQYHVSRNEYFVKAWEKLKKDKQGTKDRIKLLTEQPGLSAQTGNQAALSLTGGASSGTALGSSKARG